MNFQRPGSRSPSHSCHFPSFQPGPALEPDRHDKNDKNGPRKRAPDELSRKQEVTAMTRMTRMTGARKRRARATSDSNDKNDKNYGSDGARKKGPEPPADKHQRAGG